MTADFRFQVPEPTSVPMELLLNSKSKIQSSNPKNHMSRWPVEIPILSNPAFKIQDSSPKNHSNSWAGDPPDFRIQNSSPMIQRFPLECASLWSGRFQDPRVQISYWVQNRPLLLPVNGERDIAPTHARRLPRPSTALYRGFSASAWTFMTVGSDVTVKNTPVWANFSTLGAMIHHPALQGLSRQTGHGLAPIRPASRPRPPEARSMARTKA